MTLADAPLILRLNSDPEVLKYLHEPALRDETHATEILEKVILPQYIRFNLGRWAVELKADNTFIGWCGLKNRPEIDEVDLGYRLMQPFWGYGYATEAARHCLHYGFTTARLPVITGRTHTDNTASLAILQKIGMQYIKDEMEDDCPVKIFRAFNPNS